MMNSRTLWNDNWYFAKTALGVNWEDRQIWEAKMQPVDLPHDWLIYDTKNLYEDSIGWYRKNLPMPRIKQEMMTVSSSALKVSTWILLFM